MTDNNKATVGITAQKIEEIARVCHEANRAYCETLGDGLQSPWEDAPDWQRESAIKGVEFCAFERSASASALHNNWLLEKDEDGWVYGEVKDAEKKTHPCIVPFEKLPYAQQMKDYLFKGIVEVFLNGVLPPAAQTEDKLIQAVAPTPTIGRIVIYKTTEQDREKQRGMPNCNVSDELPAIITHVSGWGPGKGDHIVNLKIILDGDVLEMWKTSVPKGDEEFSWHWPPRV